MNVTPVQTASGTFPATPDRRERLVLLSVLLALFLGALEQTIVAPAMADIGVALGDADLLPWVATAYLIAVTAASPILGATADIVGRRPTLFLSLGLFLAGSTGAAMATDMVALVGARVVQGAGAGGLISLPFIVIADKVPLLRRAIYSAYISTVFLIATVVGPLAGGFMAQYLHWSAIFWINLPLGGIALVAIALYLRDDALNPTGRRIDFLGAAVLVCASTASVLTFEAYQGLDGLPFSPGQVLVVAIAAWIGFAWRMLKAQSPLVPVQVMTDRTISLAAIGMLCAQGSNIGLSFYLPLFYQAQLGLSASEAGMATLGMLAGVTLGAYIPARILAIQPRYKTMSVVAASGAFVAAATLGPVLAFVETLPTVIAATAVMGAGIGVLYPVLIVATQNAADRDRIGAAMGVLGFTRAMGGSVGVATVGAIVVSVGLTDAATGGIGGSIDVWPMAMVPAILMFICLIAMLLLPDRELHDSTAPAGKSAPPVGEQAG